MAITFVKTWYLELINPLVQDYAHRFSSEEDPLLREITEYTTANHPDPHMLSGHLQGIFLEMVCRMIRPHRILEIGTFTGYSAICLAKGLREGGKLHTIEVREQEADAAERFFQKSGMADRIILHRGNALEIIPGLEESWDLVFIDADKPGYIDYFNLVLRKLRENGFILADNIFFHGQAIGEEPKGKNAKAIAAFNEYIGQHKEVEKLVLTIRDGLFLIRKK